MSNIDKLNSYANAALKDIDFNEDCYEVDFAVQSNCSYLKDLIVELEEGKPLWGQGNNQPLVYIKDIYLSPNDYTIIGKNNDTIKFTYNNITYLCFKAQKEIEELSMYNNRIKVNIVGKTNVNVYYNSRTPQIFIDKMEICEIDDFGF